MKRLQTTSKGGASEDLSSGLILVQVAIFEPFSFTYDLILWFDTMSRHLPALEEHVKLAIDKAIQSFLDGPNSGWCNCCVRNAMTVFSCHSELEFPSSLSNEERKYIHNVAPRFGFQTKSHG